MRPLIPQPLKSLSTMLMTTLLLIVCMTALPACGRKQDPTANAIITSASKPRMVAADTPIQTYIKDATGKLTLTNDVAKKGEYLVGDPGPAPKPNCATGRCAAPIGTTPPQVDPPAPAAPVSLQPK